MPRTMPVGRGPELEELRAAHAAAQASGAAVVFLTGPTGSGKSALLGAFTAEVTESDDAPEARSFVCDEFSDMNALGPFGDILRSLTEPSAGRRRAERAKKLIAEVVPTLAGLIPTIGTLAER